MMSRIIKAESLAGVHTHTHTHTHTQVIQKKQKIYIKEKKAILYCPVVIMTLDNIIVSFCHVYE